MVISESTGTAGSPHDIAALIEATEWQGTPVGPPSDWPESLRASIGIMVNSAFPMVVMWGRELVLFYNASYVPVLGDKHPWAMGKPMREVWPEIWDTIGPMLRSVLDTGVATYDEDLLLPLFRNGYLEECYFTFSYSPIEDRGTIAGVFCAVAETSRNVIGERRLRTLHDLQARAFDAKSVDDACSNAAEALRGNPHDVPFSRIYLLDKNDRLRLTDYSGPFPETGEDWPVEEVARQNASRIVPSCIDATSTLSSRQRVSEALVLPIASSGQATATGAIVLGISPFTALDAEYRRFLELVAGQIAASINGARAYADAQSKAEALAELDRAKTAFFSNVSHEFRTPLTLMLGPIENILGREDSVDAAIRSELATARRNAYRLLKLVNHLLEFSRLESDRAVASYELTDIATFTRDVASGFRSAIESAGLKLDVRVPAAIHAYVDRGMFERVLLNLLSNAIKHTFRGRIVVSAWSDGGVAHIRVADTGTGIAADDLPKIFERFYRIRGVKSRVDEGSGIGLALVDEVVRLHGGKIDVESRVGEGSTFTVSLPLGKAHLPSEHIVASSAPARPSVSRLTQYVEEVAGWIPQLDGAEDARRDAAQTILVVDDNADLRAYLRRVLSRRWNVEAATDGLEALELIKERRPNLVIADVMMPRCDGIELLRRIRSDPETETMAVILLSARAGEESSVDGFKHGADDYIVKPFSEERLLARVDAALRVAMVRQQSFENIRRALDFMRLLADSIPQIVVSTAADGTTEFFNRRWYEYTGLTPEESRGAGWANAFHPDDKDSLIDAWWSAVAAGENMSAETRVRAKDGSYHWFLYRAAPLRDADGRIVRWFATATDIDDQKQLQERQQFLAHVSSVLTSTLDAGEILQKITELCVPTFADWCQVQVRSAEGGFTVEAVHHRDPQRRSVLERLLGRAVIAAESALGSPEVVRTRKIRVLDHAMTLRAVQENVRDPADRAAYEAAGLGSALIVPLVVRDEAVGTLHLVNVDETVVPSPSKLIIAEELARRAALAIDNSRLYQREHRVATALQQAMLPTHLPELSRIDFSSAYRPAEQESQVGGDWYDAFLLAPDRLAVSIGDVGGHGLGAAVAMSEARQALRLSALEGLPPAEILRRANSTLGLNERQPIITAIFGIVDVSRSTFTYSCAGHPEPALTTLSGEARYLAGGGVPLGVVRDAAFPTHEVGLEPYSTLLLYTDGLIEFSRNIAVEHARLLDALANRVQDALPDGAEALLRYMLNRRQLDDIAILVATMLPEKAEPIAVTLRSFPQAAGIARRIASRFARVAGLGEEPAFNLALAVGEAVANVVEHAYGAERGDVTLRIELRGGSVHVAVADRGTWRDGPPVQDRGRGLGILRALSRNLRMDRSPSGTTVTFEI